MSERGRCLSADWALAGLVLGVVATGCSVTQREAPVLQGGTCALIPHNICAQLEPGPTGGAGLRYIAPDVHWSQYTKVLVSPVTAWGGDTTKLSPADTQMLRAELLGTDSVSGKVLAAAVDRRVGGGSIETAAQWQWGDGENAMNKWAELSVNRLVALQSAQQ